MRAVKLYADGDGDKHDEGAGEVVQHRIDEGAFEREAAHTDQDCEHGGIENRRFEDHQKEVFETFLLSSDQCSAPCIRGDIHEDHEQSHVPHGFIQAGRFSARGEGRVAEDEDHQRGTEVAGIGKGGDRRKVGSLGRIFCKEMGNPLRDHVGKREQNESRWEQRQISRRRLVFIHAEKHEARKHYIDGEFRVRGDIELEFTVQKPAAADEDKEGEYIIP